MKRVIMLQVLGYTELSFVFKHQSSQLCKTSKNHNTQAKCLYEKSPENINLPADGQKRCRLIIE